MGLIHHCFILLYAKICLVRNKKNVLQKKLPKQKKKKEKKEKKREEKEIGKRKEEFRTSMKEKV